MSLTISGDDQTYLRQLANQTGWSEESFISLAVKLLHKQRIRNGTAYVYKQIDEWNWKYRVSPLIIDLAGFTTDERLDIIAKVVAISPMDSDVIFERKDHKLTVRDKRLSEDQAIKEFLIDG